MTDNTEPALEQPDKAQRIVYWLALALVIVGLLNSMPGVPGLDDLMISITGWKDFTIRTYPYEYFYPLVFFVMMLIVALKHSQWRASADKPRCHRSA